MLIYFCAKIHNYTIVPFLETWGAPLKPQVRVVAYQDAATVQFEGVTTVIFADFDRLSATRRVKMGVLADQLIGRGVRVLNHPQKSLLRAQFLRELYAAKLNSFRAFPMPELPVHYAKFLKFPVFVRLANDHMGPSSDLLHTPEQLQRTLAVARQKNVLPGELLIVEFCNTLGSDGLYRKYSCFYVDGAVLPRHMIASKGWVVRTPDLITPELIQEERVFLENNPHQQLVRRAFETAKMGYGRIDYSVVDDQVQVWEINSNPYVMYPPEKYQPLQLPNQQWFAPRIVQCFEALFTPQQPKLPGDLDHPVT